MNKPASCDKHSARNGPRRAIAWALPAWLTGDPEASVYAVLSHDHGPHPRFDVIRRQADARVGLSRSFVGGRLSMSLGVRGSFFAPDPDLALAGDRLAPHRAMMLEAAGTLDLRDDPQLPREGLYARVVVQRAGLGAASSWDYLRVTAEARAYVPLPAGIVIAARFSIGAMFVLDDRGLGPDAIYDLDELGPLSDQLQGGGARSHRGYPRGGLGAVRRSLDDTVCPEFYA